MTESGDSTGLAEYIRTFQAEGYRVDEVVQSKCATCDGRVFEVLLDDLNGVAQRTCVRCGTAAYIADGADHLDEAELVICECPCGEAEFEVGVGFSLHADREVRWISVGLRCVADGAVGVYADWKINYGPSAHLLDEC
ncbi:hypothetical protein BJF79_09815 [Actinomadura sp. CNU-125]|uniref:hypothetical protein n=1 Tax=Actinomadura sp. CNU-125 TaxID=1904961 RepID=UPI00096A12A7|nr:hypothetical protein [Actinomadura sp. CNU-125]OLT30226.1 hypothetical protein BJF79_09815 [Actinomadura sp. CNU-125]